MDNALRRILFIEDELAFAVGVVDRLEAEGYSVELVRHGTEGFERARGGGFDLIVLDGMLPGMSGFDVCRDLRKQSIQTPILMLTARGELTDRVVGLKLGADDYLVKPFAVAELLARIEALLRRTAPAPAGDIQIDVDRGEARCQGKLLSLSRAEFRLLGYLLEHRGRVISREELLEKVWSMQGDTLSRTIDVHVASLRKKIEPDARYPRYLITVKGFGYKLA
jgi:DNA-binding response OmpR family regulator